MDEDRINVQNTQVAGRQFIYWPDFVDRATYAQDVLTNKIERISAGGYISNDLTVRKAIASVFKLRTFRK